ncbi:MAG: hypothetical protein R3E44_04140 [Paracoccaceae bacterium]
MAPTPSLTLFFIVEPPDYQNMACYLAASIREQFGAAVQLVGYCPQHRRHEVDDNVTRVLDRLHCEIRTFVAEGRFDPPYPHGNKILAAQEPRDTEYSGFMDSDILCIRPNRVENILHPGAVSLTLAASMNWAPQTIWDQIYDACGMSVPEERVMLARQKRGEPKVPYYSSGFVTFPEQHRSADGFSFPQTWMNIAQTLDAAPGIPKKRPYLDQMSLPLAIRAAGLSPHLMDEGQHYILGGRSRGEPLPEDREIFTVHYRRWLLIKEAGLSRLGKDMLYKHAGVRRMAQVGTDADAA